MADYVPRTRIPAVAGTFYPAEPSQLATMIDRFVANVSPSPESAHPPGILIVPHAGYRYSGQVAATGFAQIPPESIKRVILLGVSHRDAFRGAAIYGGDCWQTPLGTVCVDRRTVEHLTELSHVFFCNTEVHAFEHGLEVEVPFLQRLLDEFEIVPILLHQPTSAQIETISTLLANIIDERTLLVVSSDLSHYPSQTDAEVVDHETIAGILSGDSDHFRTTTKHLLHDAGIPNLRTCACGGVAIQIGMHVAQDLDLTDIRLLHYTNSGAVGGDSTQVVGYAAIGFYPESTPSSVSDS